MRILVVDDDDMNLQMAHFILEKEFPDAQIICVDSGYKCIERLQKREGFDLILLDVQMPRLDGIKTLETIRGHQAWQSIPVAFLTASADKTTVVKASQLKVADYIKKPFTPKDLTARVKRILDTNKSTKSAPKSAEEAALKNRMKETEQLLQDLKNLGI